MRQLVNWFRRKQLERDLERELHYHLERRITDLESSGLPAAEARRRAMMELGAPATRPTAVRNPVFHGIVDSQGGDRWDRVESQWVVDDSNRP
jgi:hypothetical protein